VLNGLDRFLLFVALPTVVVASMLEAIILARLRSYDWRASAVSLFDLFARVAVQIFLPLSIATPLIVLAYRHRIGQIGLDGWPARSSAGSSTCSTRHRRTASITPPTSSTSTPTTAAC
jgi:hypothetical protein